MRRWHTREGYRARVLEIASRLPYFGLGADIIVGFPGESEADHAETRSLVEELPYTYLHVFPFSARRGTAAASLPDTVPGTIKAARSRELRELGLAGGRAYRASRVGGRAEMVVETLPEGQEGATGLTEDYLRVEVALEDFGGPVGLQRGAVLRGTLGGDSDRLRLTAAS
jgi:threonylcarbamoyladenosine tRNA methylthiotransferase MtaB